MSDSTPTLERIARAVSEAGGAADWEHALEVARAALDASGNDERWQPIETAPMDKLFLAAIWHGQAGYVVCQARRTVAGVFDVMEDSCVGWRPGYRPAFWQPLPEPPTAIARTQEQSE